MTVLIIAGSIIGLACCAYSVADWLKARKRKKINNIVFLNIKKWKGIQKGGDRCGGH